jgi:hypothetical protein
VEVAARSARDQNLHPHVYGLCIHPSDRARTERARVEPCRRFRRR